MGLIWRVVRRRRLGLIGNYKNPDMKKLFFAAALWCAAMLWPGSVSAKDVHVYTPDGKLTETVRNVRRVEFSGGKLNLVTNDRKVRSFPATETGFLSFTTKTPSGVGDVVAEEDIRLETDGLRGRVISSWPEAVTVYDVEGREVARGHNEGGAYSFSVGQAGVYVVYAEGSGKSAMLKIIMKGQ